MSGPAANLTPTQYRQASDPRALLEVVFIAIAVAILLAFFGRAHRLQAGLALALLGQVGMVTWLWRLFYRTAMSPQTIAVSAFFFGLMSLGLRWMLSAHGNSRYPARVGSLLADFVLPSAIAWNGRRLAPLCLDLPPSLQAADSRRVGFPAGKFVGSTAPCSASHGESVGGPLRRALPPHWLFSLPLPGEANPSTRAFERAQACREPSRDGLLPQSSR